MQSPEQARIIARSLVERGIAAGATQADALYVGEQSSSVQVRLGEIENVSRSEGELVGLRLFAGERSATTASSDLGDDALEGLVLRCLAMAKEAPVDAFAGLAPAELLQRGDLPLLDAEDDCEPDPTDLRARALAAEAEALSVKGVTNSSGAGAGASVSTVALATSDGFFGAYRSTGHNCSVAVIAGEGASMQRDYATHGARHLEDLDSPIDLGRSAGERAAARLNSTRPRPGRYPVIFDPRVAFTLLSHFSGAISGSAVAAGTSFLRDKLGAQIFDRGVTIVDDPLRRRGPRSRPFDGEGVAVARRELVSNGIVTSWIAESSSARQLGIQPTGHAARGAAGTPGASPSNLYLAAGSRSREDLLAAVPEAVLIVELIGQGANLVTGDYSRGAVGFMVRRGEIAEPVSEFTIAGNLLEMFATLEPGDDLQFRRGIDAPSVLIPEMTVGAA